MRPAFSGGAACWLTLFGTLGASAFLSHASSLPNVTHSGYLEVNKKEQAALFYAYYERVNQTLGNNAPVVLWLQVSGSPGSKIDVFDWQVSCLTHLSCAGWTR